MKTLKERQRVWRPTNVHQMQALMAAGTREGMRVHLPRSTGPLQRKMKQYEKQLPAPLTTEEYLKDLRWLLAGPWEKLLVGTYAIGTWHIVAASILLRLEDEINEALARPALAEPAGGDDAGG